MRRPTRAAAAVALVTAVVAACGTQTGARDSALPLLQLTDAGGQRALGLPEPAYDGTRGTPPYVLRTALPSGTPAPAPVWRFPKTTATDAGRVVAALGATATPTPVDGGWVARSGSHLLTVRDDGSWSWGIDCMPDVPVEQESLQVACGSAVTTPAQPVGPTVGRARELADPILRRLGWDGDVAAVRGSPMTTVTARRSVDGTDTADWLTTLSFTVGDLLDAANGWVAEPVRGRAYPLVDAATALRTLESQPQPLSQLCRVRADGRPGCEPMTPRVITGARLGLALRHEPDRALVVPAWLFDVAGDSQPLAVVAVATRFLATPKPVPMGTPKSVAPAATPSSPR
jgi:hypothetical protein